ncbi:MAG: M15 family metallopeptidase [Angelakisella sp.]
MASYYKRNRRAEIIRNRVLVVLLAVVLVLVGWIVVVRWQSGKQPQESSSVSESSAPPASSATSAAPVASSVPESQPESQSSATSLAPESKSASASSTAASQSGSSSTSSDASQPTALYYEEKMPVLVNPTNKIPEGYDPDVVDLGNGMSLNRKAAKAYDSMLRKANKDGITLWLVSAYRSTERQVVVFNTKVKEYEAAGYTHEQACAATATHIAVPGTSEHSLGLATDINSLETTFEDTKAFRWLIANCADFGFILRYPKGKEDITGIAYEPWHYRYVGSNHAKIIMEKGLCLEEYLSGDY